MGKEDSGHKSALGQAIEAQERKVYTFDVNGFFGLGDKPIYQIAIRSPIKDEEDGAVDAAHIYAKDRAHTDSAAQDPDLLTDAKLIEILRKVCIEPPQPGHPVYQVFSSSEWMRKHLRSDQIAALFNLVQEVRRKESALAVAIDFDLVEALAKACSRSASTELPEAILAPCTREYLSQAFVLLSMRLGELLGWNKPEQDERDDRHVGDDSGAPVGNS